MSMLTDEIRQGRAFDSAAQEAFLSLGRTWSVLEHAISEVLRPYGITGAQYNVLRILKGSGRAGLCRREVGDRMVAKVPDMTRLLDRLEVAGLIVRVRDSEDRRYVSTRITPEGLEVVAKAEGPVLELHRRQFAGLASAEQQLLIDLLERVREPR